MGSELPLHPRPLHPRSLPQPPLEPLLLLGSLRERAISFIGGDYRGRPDDPVRTQGTAPRASWAQAPVLSRSRQILSTQPGALPAGASAGKEARSPGDRCLLLFFKLLGQVRKEGRELLYRGPRAGPAGRGAGWGGSAAGGCRGAGGGAGARPGTQRGGEVAGAARGSPGRGPCAGRGRGHQGQGLGDNPRCTVPSSTGSFDPHDPHPRRTAMAEGCGGTLPGGAQGFPEVPRDAWGFPGVPWGFPEVPGGSQGCPGVPRGARGSPGVPGGSQGCSVVLSGSQGCPEVSRGARVFPGVPRGARVFQGVPGSAQGFPEVPGCS